jgi:Tfp pilus assembly protein PilZ
METDRRLHERIQAQQMEGQLKLEQEATARALAVDNISMGGLFLRCEETLPVGSPVLVEISCPLLERPLEVTGRVVSNVGGQVGEATGPSTPGMGVRFDSLEPELSERMTALLAQLSSRQEQGGQLFSLSGRPASGGGGILDALAKNPELLSTPAAEAQPLTLSPGSGVVVQVHGLLKDTAEAKRQLLERDREIASLKGEVAQLREELARRPAIT